MIGLEHVAIWAMDLELLKMYYTKYFEAKSNSLYQNPKTGFKSYFLSFDSGARLEIMQMEGIPQTKDDSKISQHTGLIHLAFGVESKSAVDQKAEDLKAAGFEILRGPRTTGDGYYEFETLDPEGNRLEVTFKP
jgi:lactoylglutathione lyase